MKNFILILLMSLLFVDCIGNVDPDPEDLICAPSSELDAINITENTAVIVWSHPEKGGESTNFTVEYGVKGFDLGSGLTSDETLFKNIIIIDLEPATEYEYYVRTRCDNGISGIIAGPKEFVTD